MRQIDVKSVTEVLSRLLQDVCYHLSDDLTTALRRAYDREKSPASRPVLAKLLENSEVAVRDEIPLCQDTGMAVVFLELRQDVHLVGAICTKPFRRGRAWPIPRDTCENRLWTGRFR
jgi:fumarate hydratase subunit alpha